MERPIVIGDPCGTAKEETYQRFLARSALLISTVPEAFLIERYRRNAEGIHICALGCLQKEASEWFGDAVSLAGVPRMCEGER